MSELERIEDWVALDLKTDGADAGVIEGYASRFGEKDRGNDIVMPGAFAKTLRDKRTQRVPMLYGHKQEHLAIGAWTQMAEDREGLKVRGRLALGSDAGKQIYEVLRLGAEFGISIGYRTVRWEFDEKASVRRLIEVDLFEVSLVAIPMLESARVTKVKADAPADDGRWASVIHAANQAAQSLDLMMSVERATESVGRR